MDHQTLDVLLDKFKTPAICIWPSWPLRAGVAEVGHLGGRPRLPDGAAWPRSASGTALHFLAMIDCAELQDPTGRLPDAGVLFFFALMDEDGTFDEDGATQVLFFENGGSVDVMPPDDLGKIMGGYDGFSQHAGLSEDRPTAEFNRWPLEAFGVQDWPEHGALPSNDRAEITKTDYDDRGDYPYDTQVRKHRAAQRPKFKTPDQPVWKLPNLTTLKDTDLCLTAIADRPDFPQVNGMIESICRAYEQGKQRELQRHTKKPAPPKPLKKAGLGGLLDRLRGNAPIAEPINAKVEKQNRYIAVASDRVEQSRVLRQKAASLGLGNTPTKEDRDAFIQWLIYHNPEDARHKWNMQSAYDSGLSLTLRRLGACPDAAQKIPDAMFEEFPETAHHQMLGFGPSDLGPNNPDDTLLLMLRSDARANFMFGDAGELCFYIDPANLEARNFDLAYTKSTGGG